jgi:CheY-like chemotaxis protein
MSRILIIEDDNEVREYLESVISRAGYEVVSAENGKDGVQLFQEQPADLVVTDILHGRAVANEDALANPESLDFFREIAGQLETG